MPLPSFATLEQRLATANVGAFANATLSWTGNSVDCVFDAPYLDALGMSNSAPSVACLEGDVSALAVDAAVSLLRNSVTTAYTVREKQPDGNGVTRLILQAA